MEGLRDARARIEASWEEQRSYVTRAEELLGVVPDEKTSLPDLGAYEEIETPEAVDVEISWQIFDNSDYQRYQRDYMRCHLEWAIWDFTKVGLPDEKGGIYTARVTRAYRSQAKRLYRLEFSEEVQKRYGLPYFYLEREGERLTVRWFDKKCSRLPQACWLKIGGLEEDWQIQKMGQWISPSEIIGSPLICGIDEAVKNPSVVVESLDCALVAPFGRRLLQYGCKDCKQDLYFNLYNNIWNTNFPMWYTDDATFRFFVKRQG
jgi:hypothetical protein